MSLVAFASIKGSPGVTTTALAMAAVWPAPRELLLVEADPFGGDIAARYDVVVTTGLAGLVASARRDLSPEAVWKHASTLPGGLRVIFGLSGPAQAIANERVWPTIVTALTALDADVIVDCGRLLPGFGGGIRDVLARADVAMILTEPALESIAHLAEALPSLATALGTRRLVVVPTAAKGYSSIEIAAALKVDVGRSLPHDQKAAVALANRPAGKLAKRSLLKWASAQIGELGLAEAASHAATSEPGEAADALRTNGTQPPPSAPYETLDEVGH